MRPTAFRAALAPVVLAALLGLTACGGKGGTTIPSSSGAGSGSSSSAPSAVSSSSGGASPSSSGQSPAPAESPVPAESNPPGDIPDSTQFVPYHSAGGHFVLRVPEGWARTTTKDSVTFVSKLNSIEVMWTQASSAPTVASDRSKEVPLLKRTERAFTFKGAQEVSLPGGKAVLLKYQVNSSPNSVTGKQYRLDVLRFELFKGGTEAALILSSPVGADNVDPWRIVSESFKWA